MKLTMSKLKQLIKEEIKRVLESDLENGPSKYDVENYFVICLKCKKTTGIDDLQDYSSHEMQCPKCGNTDEKLFKAKDLKFARQYGWTGN